MLMKTDNAAEVGVHVFERAKLGKAPFKCVGYYEKVYRATPDSPGQPGGSCDFCGTAITLHCQIRGADGSTFVVGSDCVAKTGDAGLIRSFKARPEVRAAAKAKRDAKDAANRAAFDALMADPIVTAKLEAIIVPGKPWIPGDTSTLLADVKRVWRMCGAAGRARNLRALKARLAGAS